MRSTAVGRPRPRTYVSNLVTASRYVNTVIGLLLSARSDRRSSRPGHRWSVRRRRWGAFRPFWALRESVRLECRRHSASPENRRAPQLEGLFTRDSVVWSGRRDSNPRHSAWEADTLPAELLPLEEAAAVGPPLGRSLAWMPARREPRRAPVPDAGMSGIAGRWLAPASSRSSRPPAHEMKRSPYLAYVFLPMCAANP